MSLRLIQVRAADGQRVVAGIVGKGVARKVKDCSSTDELAQTALNGGTSLEKCVAARLSDERLDLEDPRFLFSRSAVAAMP